MPELRRMRGKRRRKFIVACFCFTFASCNGSRDKGTVVVRVFRDSDSDFHRDLDSKLYGFNSLNHQLRVNSGKLIFVATLEGNYKEELDKIALLKPQMIILDSSADAQSLRGIQVDIGKPKNACGTNWNCPAFIPPWVSGEELEASTMLFDAITRAPELESPPGDGPSSR
jgi:hypothetical protein